MMADNTGTVSVALDRVLYQRLKEIAERRHCAVDDLVGESVKIRYSLHTAQERRAAVDSLETMDLPVGSWDEMEKEIIAGATQP
ncbi:MAG: hypothetical protein M0R80_21735 [Proteobacteria bacterium]|jgi:hypothetical protein|nr:hypothetical protein [Pseudomonadota bacterium]